jgi:hypothetical protein
LQKREYFPEEFPVAFFCRSVIPARRIFSATDETEKSVAGKRFGVLSTQLRA